MSRRLPTFFPLMLAATVGLFALTSVLTAQPPQAPPNGKAPDGGQLTAEQEARLKLYREFAASLFKIAKKWEKGTPEEQDRAKVILNALRVAEEKGIDRMFKEVVDGLSGTRNPTDPAFEKLIQKDKDLTAALEQVLKILQGEGELASLQKQIDDLTKQKEDAERLLRQQENLRARTENPKGDPNKLANEQGRLAQDTQKLADRIGGKEPSGNPNDGGKDDKAEEKSSPKPGEQPGEPKSDTDQPQSTNKDPMGGMGGDPMMGGDPKSPPKDGMGSDMAGSSKPTPKDGMGSDMAGGAKPMGDPKDNPMGMNPSGMNPKDPSGMNPMSPSSSKPSPSSSKSQADGKGDSKPSAGQQGSDAKPMNSPSSPSPSSPSSSKGSPSSPSPSSPSPSNPSNPNNKPNEAQKNLGDAVPPQQGAQKDLKNDNREQASKNQDKAIEQIKKAIEELEKKLKQLREKEMAKKLADLEQRVRAMLQMQKDVLAKTIEIDRAIRSNNNQVTDPDRTKSQLQGDAERLIIDEADNALKVLQGEGTAVVFAGVLVEVRKDMEAIREQLLATRVGEDTQLIEQQVIEQLERMLEALKKAQQEMEPSQPPPPGEPPPPSDPPKKDLIQLVEQLKLLKALQVQVNDRTAAFGKKTAGLQATEKFTQDQLKMLGERQRLLQEMLLKIAQGDR